MTAKSLLMLALLWAGALTAAPPGEKPEPARADWKEIKTLEWEPQRFVTGLASTPNGKSLSLSGQTVRLVDVATGEVGQPYRGKGLQSADLLTVSPDGGTAAAFDLIDKEVRTWDLATGKEKHVVQW